FILLIRVLKSPDFLRRYHRCLFRSGRISSPACFGVRVLPKRTSRDACSTQNQQAGMRRFYLNEQAGEA
ncbi:MAG: hypothetical protein ACPGWR_33745, partial [Ardenticatenaceae bacterium]